MFDFRLRVQGPKNKYGKDEAMAIARMIRAKSDPSFKEKLEKATLAKLAELPSLKAMNTYKKVLEQGKLVYLVSISKSNGVIFCFEKSNGVKFCFEK